MFCGNCGNHLEDGARFCMACGKAAEAPAAQQYAPQAIVAQHPAPVPPQVKKRGRPSILLILVGLLMVLLSVSQQAALVFGLRATGVVSSVDQIFDSSSERTDYNYRITYRFAASDGKDHTGSYSMSHVYSDANLPSVGSTLSVAYIPGFPQVNSVGGRVDLGLATFVTIGIGVLLIILGVKNGKFSH